MAVQIRRRLLWTLFRTVEKPPPFASAFFSVMPASHRWSSPPHRQGCVTVLSLGQGKQQQVCDPFAQGGDHCQRRLARTLFTVCAPCRRPVTSCVQSPGAMLSWPSRQGDDRWCAAPSSAVGVTPVTRVQCVRHKSGGKKSKRSAGSSSDEEEDVEELDEDDYEAPPQFKKMQIYVKSLRADSVVSSALDISRNRVDEVFYGSRLRLNGEKLLKKSKQMTEGDYVDVIVERSSEDDKLLVKRVKVMDVSSERTNKDKTVVTVKVWKAPFPIEDASKGEWTQH